jgi:hypothetical protein
MGLNEEKEIEKTVEIVLRDFNTIVENWYHEGLSLPRCLTALLQCTTYSIIEKAPNTLAAFDVLSRGIKAGTDWSNEDKSLS